MHTQALMSINLNLSLKYAINDLNMGNIKKIMCMLSD